jgi:acetoin:2,6-dichlorophenolindophenol oxidoreductase subunit beta
MYSASLPKRSNRRMPRITYLEATMQAIQEEMRRNPRVFVMGEDIQSGVFGDFGLSEFGRERVRNTPISEGAFIGAGIGAALTGMRPVIDIACSTFLYSAMDQIANQAAKSRYMFGGQSSVPLVIRATVMYGVSAAAHHSDRPWGLFAQVPGLTIITPATPFDAKGLLKAAIRSGNPTLFLEELLLKDQHGDVPAGDYTVSIGLAEVKRVGTDLTIVALAGAVHSSLTAAEALESDGISAEVVDLRTVVPLDRDTIRNSVIKTGHLLIVDPAPRMCSVASEVAASAAETAFEYLRAPIIRLTAPDIPVPFSPDLERLMYPTADSIAVAARKLCHSQCRMRGQQPASDAGLDLPLNQAVDIHL